MMTEIESTMQSYELAVEAVEKSAVETGSKLRDYLLPILHRWGMGMEKGGKLMYHQPNVDEIAAGSWHVYMDKECDYALGAVHPDLAEALWRTVYPSEDDTFHDYVEDIHIPFQSERTSPYMWVVRDRGGLQGGVITWCEPRVISFTDSLEDELVPGSALYHGPITNDYIEDVTAHGDISDFIHALPMYAVNDDCKWELTDSREYMGYAPKVGPHSSTGGYTLHYGKDYPAIRDCNVDNLALALAYRDVYTSTGLVVEAALCYLMEGLLVNVTIEVEGRPLTIDLDRGIVTNWSNFPSSANYSKRLMMAFIGKQGAGNKVIG